jgi:hypothetical protein
MAQPLERSPVRGAAEASSSDSGDDTRAARPDGLDRDLVSIVRCDGATGVNGESMLRRMNDMPAGTIGFEAVGEVEDDDWEETVEPLLRQRIAAGEKVRLLYLLGLQATDVESDAMKADTGFRARHPGAFERVAIVADESWIKPAIKAWSIIMPGKARAFAVHDLPAAKTWLAEGQERAA